jgi:hypothetical protein
MNCYGRLVVLIQIMDTHVYGGPGNVVVDNCPRCAVKWLDHGELKISSTLPAGIVGWDLRASECYSLRDSVICLALARALTAS